MFIDTHAHIGYTIAKLDCQPEQLMLEAHAQNVNLLIDIGCDISSSMDVLRYSQKFPKIVAASVAIHPSTIEEFDRFEELQVLAHDQGSNLIAIGETGLDYYWHKNYEEQKALFIRHIELANELKLPVIVHCRDAYEDCLEIIHQYPTTVFVMHSFNANYELTQLFLKIPNIWFGINGIVTFKNAPELQQIVAEIPLERILLETDCPYLAPHPFRGKTNEPKYIPYIAVKIAELKKVEVTSVENTTTANAIQVFSLEDLSV